MAIKVGINGFGRINSYQYGIGSGYNGKFSELKGRLNSIAVRVLLAIVSSLYRQIDK
jgi:glyceraldehyde-3-phosphate dehydrogenase/erythrose-4-phosphate dehydrogenase